MDSALNNDIERVSELSRNGNYDFIIVGSGLAGGILARSLIQKKYRILLIEKGNVKFSTHCLNLSRPHWQIGGTEGPSQDNDVVYAADKQKVLTAEGSDSYVGGPVYCLGGRSNVWGLYSPRIPAEQHKEYFPSAISGYLEKDGYKKAFRLFTNGSQDIENVYPNDVIGPAELNEARNNLNGVINEFYKQRHSQAKVPTVELAPVAAEFPSGKSKVFGFPQGAYSTVDYLFDRIYARDENLTVLLNTEVLTFSTDGDATLPSVMVQSAISKSVYRLSASKIILCAGTLGTATIALNSGLQRKVPFVGQGLNDHEIWGIRFMKEKSTDEKKMVSMKWHCNMSIGGGDALMNVIINGNSFLARNFFETQILDSHDKPISLNTDKFDTINITFELQAELSDKNRVLKGSNSESVVYIKREPQDKKIEDEKQKQMQDLAKQIRTSFLGNKDPDDVPPLSKAGFGVVAHEVGTMRMQGPKTRDKYVVDENLQVKGVKNIYVCDLSIFPYSPPANPSLTLAGIALWLADQLAK